MREHLVAEDGIRDLRSMHQIHLKKPCLQWSLFRFVLLQRVQKEGGRWLDHVLGHEDINNLSPSELIIGAKKKKVNIPAQRQQEAHSRR